jgi:hypothetical protein
MKQAAYLTITQLAKKAKVEPLTVAFKVSTHEIKALKVEGRVFIKAEEAAEFIEQVKAHRKKQTQIAYS